jgi:DNA-binding transcriptional regulator GbsR (MarR family)
MSFFVEIMQLIGIPKSVGQIYGLLYASPESPGFTAIVERLGISKGSASQGLQLLRTLGAIYEVKQNGVTKRGLTYEVELSLRQLVTGILRERIATSASAGADRLKHLKHLAGQSPAHSAFYLERVSQLTTWSKRLTTVLPLLSALFGPLRKKSL